MRIITSTGPPPDATTALPVPRPTFALISSMPSVRARLYNEQKGLCAYCEKRVRLNGPNKVTTTRIEHFHPQSNTRPPFSPSCRTASGAATAHVSTVTWTNLLLCCSGEGFDGATCDRRKSAQDICGGFSNPKRSPSMLLTLVYIDPRGRAVPTAPNPSGACQGIIDNVFGLNDSNLVKARSTLLNAYVKQIQGAKMISKGLSPAKRRALAKRISAAAASSEYPSVLLSLASRI